MSRVVLKPRKAKPFFGRHPWVLDSAVLRVEGVPVDGDAVDLVSHQGNFVARGLYNSQSRIRVRLYTWDRNEELDPAFWQRRVQQAVELRRQMGYDDPRGAARMVFSEGDGLSGLIVDRYGEHLVVQPTALGIAVRLPVVVPMLCELLHPQSVAVRTEPAVVRAEGMQVADGPFWGEAPSGPVIIEEHGLKFRVDLATGQKTGYYLDQRENRRAAAGYLRGRRVLDMFCYSGGFGLAAAAAGAREVLGIDTSQRALELARANAELNGLTHVQYRQGNCFEAMEEMVAAGERFEAVVLDPPKFARSRRNIDEALRAYHWLNRLGVELLEPGGYLVTCSCSGHVGREEFLMMLLGVSQQTRRDLQILETRGAAPDHPVTVTCPDSEYLKCVVCRVL